LFETRKRQDNTIGNSRMMWFEKLAFMVLILNHKTSAVVGRYLPIQPIYATITLYQAEESNKR